MYSHIQVILKVDIDRTRIGHGLLTTAAPQLPLLLKRFRFLAARARAGDIGKNARRLCQVGQPRSGRRNVNVGFGYVGGTAGAWGAGGMGGYL